MKRVSFWTLGAFVALTVASVVIALDNYPAAEGGFYDSKSTNAQVAGGTNTVASAFTPRYNGDLLIGSNLNGTSNVLWIATGLGTNHWLRLGEVAK